MCRRLVSVSSIDIYLFIRAASMVFFGHLIASHLFFIEFVVVCGFTVIHVYFSSAPFFSSFISCNMYFISCFVDKGDTKG